MQARIDELLKVMAMLRDPQQGCAWDLKQDFDSIASHTLEEAYEVVDAIEQKDYAHLKNELGDLLFQVVFYARMGEEQGLFDFGDVVAEITGKLLHRHPHVFPDGTVASFGKAVDISPEQVEKNWELIKADERQEGNKGNTAAASVLDDVPASLPALNRARKIQKRAATVGFDWEHAAPVMDKVREEMAELEQAMADDDHAHMSEELGDLLFSVVNLSRHLKVEAESALRGANNRFEQRFRYLEQQIMEQGRDIQSLTLAELDGHWEQAKASLRETASKNDMESAREKAKKEAGN